jgi:hypothetical protein
MKSPDSISPILNELVWAVDRLTGTLPRVESSSGSIGLQALNFWIDHSGQHSSAQRRRSLNCECSNESIANVLSLTRVLEGA